MIVRSGVCASQQTCFEFVGQEIRLKRNGSFFQYLLFTHIVLIFADPLKLFGARFGPNDSFQVVFQFRVAEFSTRVAPVHSDEEF